MIKWMDAKRSETKKVTIVTLMQSEHSKIVEENRKYSRIILETLMFTAQQNIALRGSIESREDLDQISDTNRGNFLELLSLRARDNPWLREKLSSQLKARYSWTSPEIHNELLSMLASSVIDRIQKEVSQAKYYSIIADETADIWDFPIKGFPTPHPHPPPLKSV